MWFMSQHAAKILVLLNDHVIYVTDIEAQPHNTMMY